MQRAGVSCLNSWWKHPCLFVSGFWLFFCVDHNTYYFKSRQFSCLYIRANADDHDHHLPRGGGACRDYSASRAARMIRWLPSVPDDRIPNHGKFAFHFHSLKPDLYYKDTRHRIFMMKPRQLFVCWWAYTFQCIAFAKVHEQYGGVVPELASRAHMQHIVPVVDQAMKRAGCRMDEIDAIAFTQAPGLIELCWWRTVCQIAFAGADKPLIAVHHMQAHVLANLIDEPRPSFLLMFNGKGGHTQIVRCNSPLDMQVIGQTIDDAAMKAFDKSAKLFGLPYPGGPLIDKYAKEGNADAFKFPEPRIDGLILVFPGLNFNTFISWRMPTNQIYIKKHLSLQRKSKRFRGK